MEGEEKNAGVGSLAGKLRSQVPVVWEKVGVRSLAGELSLEITVV